MKVNKCNIYVLVVFILLAWADESRAFTFAEEVDIPVTVTLQNVMPEVSKVIVRCSIYRKAKMVGTGAQSILIGKSFAGVNSKKVTVKVRPVKGQQMYNPTKYNCALKLQDSSGEHNPIVSSQSVSGNQAHLHAADNKPYKIFFEKPV